MPFIGERRRRNEAPLVLQGALCWFGSAVKDHISYCRLHNPLIFIVGEELLGGRCGVPVSLGEHALRSGIEKLAELPSVPLYGSVLLPAHLGFLTA